MNTTWEDFYAKHPPPQDFNQNEILLKTFVERQLKKDKKVVLITVSVYSFIALYCMSILFIIITLYCTSIIII